MDTVAADDGHNFIHRAELATFEEVIRALANGEQIIYYVGESLGIAKTKSRKVRDLAGQVWKLVEEGKRGHLLTRKVGERKDGLNRYEYLAVPAKNAGAK